MPTTSRRSLLKPATGDPVSALRSAITTNADKLDQAAAYTEGPSLPASGALGDTFYKTVTGDYYLFDGDEWRFDRSSARAEAYDSNAASGNLIPWGGLVATGAGESIFGRANSNTRLTVSVAGLYRLTLRAFIGYVGGQLLIQPTGNYDVSVRVAASNELTSACVVFRLDAGGYVTLSADGTDVGISNPLIERVSP